MIIELWVVIPIVAVAFLILYVLVKYEAKRIMKNSYEAISRADQNNLHHISEWMTQAQREIHQEQKNSLKGKIIHAEAEDHKIRFVVTRVDDSR